MQQGAVASNRFGLSSKGGETPPGDPHSWLLAQFARFDTRPAPIAALPRSDRLIGMLREARDRHRSASRMPPWQAVRLAQPGRLAFPGRPVRRGRQG